MLNVVAITAAELFNKKIQIHDRDLILMKK